MKTCFICGKTSLDFENKEQSTIDYKLDFLPNTRSFLLCGEEGCSYDIRNKIHRYYRLGGKIFLTLDHNKIFYSYYDSYSEDEEIIMPSNSKKQRLEDTPFWNSQDEEELLEETEKRIKESIQEKAVRVELEKCRIKIRKFIKDQLKERIDTRLKIEKERILIE